MNLYSYSIIKDDSEIISKFLDKLKTTKASNLIENNILEFESNKTLLTEKYPDCSAIIFCFIKF